jgi:hypothetical protein
MRIVWAPGALTWKALDGDEKQPTVRSIEFVAHAWRGAGGVAKGLKSSSLSGRSAKCSEGLWPVTGGGNVVTLSSRLRHVDLTLECKSCGYLIVKRGTWFMTASTFKCCKCKAELRLTYSDKLALFAKHAHLA